MFSYMVVSSRRQHSLKPAVEKYSLSISLLVSFCRKLDKYIRKYTYVFLVLQKAFVGKGTVLSSAPINSWL